MIDDTMNFHSFGFHDGIMKALEEAGFKIPSPIQKEVIPQILAGRDLIGQAQTGTGKTGAFGLPTLHLLKNNPQSQMLVLTPTRELAKQVSDELYRFCKHIGIRIATVYGGKSAKAQIESYQKGVQIVVATPGRLLDLLESQQLQQFQPSIVVLDEADEMLDMGFLDDINLIFQFLPTERQTLLFSATMPLPIKKLSEKILQNPLFLSVKQSEKVNQDIQQYYYLIHEEERDDALIRIIDHANPEKAIVFCKTKKDVDRLTQTLLEIGYSVRGLHGDMEQRQREEVIRNFRSHHLNLLIATDVAARGLNVSNVSHVFNYQLPFDSTNYVHRIGRTGRAGKKGVACTLLTPRERHPFQRFEKALKTTVEKKEVPTMLELKQSKNLHLTKKILSHDVHKDAGHLLNLMNEFDSHTIATKLLSMLLSKESFVGPDQIGIRDERGNNEFSHKNSSPRRKSEKKPPFKFSKKNNNQFHAKRRKNQVKKNSKT